MLCKYVAKFQEPLQLPWPSFWQRSHQKPAPAVRFLCPGGGLWWFRQTRVQGHLGAAINWWILSVSIWFVFPLKDQFEWWCVSIYHCLPCIVRYNQLIPTHPISTVIFPWFPMVSHCVPARSLPWLWWRRAGKRKPKTFWRCSSLAPDRHIDIDSIETYVY